MKILNYIFISCLLMCVSFTGKALVSKPQISGINVPDFAYPKIFTYAYSVGFDQGATSIKITVSGGTYKNMVPVVIDKYTTSVTFDVVWDNVKVSGDKCEGTIKVELQYSNEKASSDLYKQKILSLNGAKAPDIEEENGKINIPFGVQELSFVTIGRENFIYPGSRILVNKCEWVVPDGWENPTFTSSPKATITTDLVSEGEVKYRGINQFYEEDKSNYCTAVKITRTGSFTATPYGMTYKWGQEYNFTYAFDAVTGVTYEWQYPSDWSVVSGANTHQIVLKRPKYSNSSTVQVRLKDSKTGKTSKWFSAPALTFEMPTLTGDRVVKNGSIFTLPGIDTKDITWSITGSDKITIDQSGVISVPAYTRTPSAEMTITATVANSPFPMKAYYLADYLEGNSVINGNTNREFYCYAPTKIPQVGIPRGAKVDITITEPYVFIGSGITYRWQATEGGSRLRALNSQPTNRCHFEVMPQAEPGPLTIHTTITLDDFLAEYDIKYYVTGYSILMSSSNILTIEKEIPEDMPTDVILLNATDATQFEYQVIETSTGVVRMSGSAPTDQRLELDVSSLRDGIYTVIVSENGEVKAQQNISL